MLASAPVLCPDPKEPTRSLSCLPQSEKDLKNMYLCTNIIFGFGFGIQNNVCAQHVLNLYFSRTEVEKQ